MKRLFFMSILVAVVACDTTKPTVGGPSNGSSRTGRATAPTSVNGTTISNSKKPAFTTSPSKASVPGGMPLPASLESLYPLQFKYAILLDIPVEEITDRKMVDYIESWYGTPYRLGGSTRSGVDCSFFVKSFISAMYNVSVPRTSKEQYDQCVRVQRDQLQEGDLVFFYTQKGKNISHVGVYLRNNKFVHASTSWGVMISDLNENYYATRFAGAGRLSK